jgi:nicotinate dehydrogenase subunit B
MTETFEQVAKGSEAGAGTWSDDMLARAIREGVGHDGRALYWQMPSSTFRNLSDEDLDG